MRKLLKNYQNMVCFHVKAIYGKLSVNNHTQAIERARQLPTLNLVSSQSYIVFSAQTTSLCSLHFSFSEQNIGIGG